MTRSHEVPPGNLQGLERWLTEWASQVEIAPGRLRRRVGITAIAAMLDGANQPTARFIFKGGAAFQFRFGDRARSSADVDLICRANLVGAMEALEAGLIAGWSGFTGRLIDLGPFDVPGVRIPPQRANAKISYKGKAFVTIPIEVAAPEGASLDRVDRVAIEPISELGLESRMSVPVLGVAYQVAQKIHACTTIADDGRANDRVRDLADLILLDELAEVELDHTATACTEIFRLRAMQPWPPDLTVWPHWPRLWAAIVRDDQFPIADLDVAAELVRSLIVRIDGVIDAGGS